MKTRELFAGCHARIEPRTDLWLVSLRGDDDVIVAMHAYHGLADGLEALHEWMLMLVDETELRPEIARNVELRQMIREALARSALGERATLPETMRALLTRDRLQAWFEREMGDTA
jgi:hypothetical protein